MKLVASWLPGGEAQLNEIPVKGEEQMLELERLESETQATFSQYAFMRLCRALLTVERINKALGFVKGKEVWDNFVVTEKGGAKEFLWPAETFERDFDLTREQVFLNNFKSSDTAIAEIELEKFVKETVNPGMVKVQDSSIKRLRQRPLLMLYWRLRGTIKAINAPQGEVVLDWSLAKQAEVLDALSEVAGKQDFDAMLPKAAPKPLDMGDLKPKTASDVEGKSSPPKGGSTA